MSVRIFNPRSFHNASIDPSSLIKLSSENAKPAGEAFSGISYQGARSDHVHPLQIDIPGNSETATRFQTARQINGIVFDGTQNIITGFWGMNRNFTIGKSTKSVNGESDIDWTISDIGAVESNLPITAGSGTKILYDAKGLVTGSSNLSPEDIPNLSWNKITSDKPTTIEGYGITDAVSGSHIGSTGDSHGLASGTEHGFMSFEDKTKLDGILEGIVSLDSLKINNLAEIKTDTVLTTSTDATQLVEFDITHYSFAKLMITAQSNSDKQITELLVVHNGTAAFSTEYGTIFTNEKLFFVTVGIVGTKVIVSVQTTTTNITTYKTTYTVI